MTRPTEDAVTAVAPVDSKATRRGIQATRVGLVGFGVAWTAFMTYGWIVLRIWPQPGLRLPGDLSWLVRAYARQDSGHFTRIARYGYLSRGRDDVNVAFFPGYPLAGRYLADVFGLGRTTPLDYAAALALTAWTGSATAAVLICRYVVERSGGGLNDRRAACMTSIAPAILLSGPCSVFLLASYSEGPFLAFAVGAWLRARRGSWLSAGLLTAGAVAVRVNGLFLLAGLLVSYAQQRPAARPRLASKPLLRLVVPPLTTIACYLWWLHSATGHWDGWLIAERRGWHRHLSWPWHALLVSVNHFLDNGSNLPAHYESGLELIFAGAYLVAGVLLARNRWWPELVYVALTGAALLTSSFYQSVPRSMTLCFPLVALLTRYVTAPRRAQGLVAIICWAAGLVVLAINTGLYLRGYFAG